MSGFDHFDDPSPYAPPKADLGGEDVGLGKTSGIDLSVQSPFLTIWTRPRATLRAILETNPSYLVIPLSMTWGVLQSLDRASQRNAGDRMSLGMILVMALVLGPIAGIIGVYLGGALIGWTGRMLGGRGRSEELRAALAWGQVPGLLTIPIWILQLALIGREMFTSDAPTLEENPNLGLILLATTAVEFILAIWAFVLMLKCVGEAHRFSAWKALGAAFLGLLVFLVPVLLLAGLAVLARNG